MGLDMYLTGEKYLSQYTPEEKAISDEISNLLGMEDLKVQEVTCELAYWRKANAIHAWFVEHVQGGEDECKKHHVPMESLDELLGVCREVVTNKEAAKHLLAPQAGFFYGRTEIDDYYFESLEETIKMLTKARKDAEEYNLDMYYQSSW